MHCCLLYLSDYSPLGKCYPLTHGASERASAGTHAHKGGYMTIIELYDLFILEQQFRNNTDVTIEWYKVQLTDFFKWLDSDDVTALTLIHFKEYAVYLRTDVRKRDGSKLSSSSVNGCMRAVKSFYNFCISEGYLPDFSRQLKLPKVHNNEKQILDDDEIKKLMNSFDKSSYDINLRNKCFVTLMLDSGLRRGEILRLNIGDIDFRNKMALVRGKGCKQRLVPLGLMSCALLTEYIENVRGCAHVWKAAEVPFFLDRFGKRCSDNLVKQVFQDLKQSSGIERLHPHLLRHTFATYYLADGGDLETLRLILGHADIQTTQTYLHLAFNLKLARSRHNSHLDKLASGE